MLLHYIRNLFTFGQNSQSHNNFITNQMLIWSMITWFDSGPPDLTQVRTTWFHSGPPDFTQDHLIWTRTTWFHLGLTDLTQSHWIWVLRLPHLTRNYLIWLIRLILLRTDWFDPVLPNCIYSRSYPSVISALQNV